MKQNKKNQWFTLVELIVVITILAILWTIVFISLQWYSSQARDSKRLSDIQNIKTSLELFSLNSWKYPSPDIWYDIIYDTEIVWTQWIVWDNVTTNLSRNLNKKPVDPLIETEYTYSVINSETQYELLSIYESDLISYNNILNQTNAVNQAYPKIDWTYNQIFIKTPTYYIPTPSIINSELDWIWWILTDDNINSQIITGWENNITNWTNEAVITWIPNLTLQAFSWTISDKNDDNKEALAQALIKAYSWILLSNKWIYKKITETDLSNSTDLISLVDDVILSSTTYASTSWTILTNSCATTPVFANILNPIIWTPTSIDQAWTYNETPWNCTYTCSNWFSWTDCEIPNPYANCTWINTPAIWNASISATTTYWEWKPEECNTKDIIVCSWEWEWYTLAACNVWAKIAWTTTASYWWLFQWWNHFDFRWWQLLEWSLYPTIDITPIDSISDYSIYSNWTFIKWINDWLNEDYNWLLRGANWNPCLDWYHVPTITEWKKVVEIKWDSDNLNSWTSMGIDLKLPIAGTRNRGNGDLKYQGQFWFYWTSTPSNLYGYYMHYYSDYISAYLESRRTDAMSIRCFKN